MTNLFLFFGVIAVLHRPHNQSRVTPTNAIRKGRMSLFLKSTAGVFIKSAVSCTCTDQKHTSVPLKGGQVQFLMWVVLDTERVLSASSVHRHLLVPNKIDRLQCM